MTAHIYVQILVNFGGFIKGKATLKSTTRIKLVLLNFKEWDQQILDKAV